MDEKKDWLKPDEILEYDEDKGNECINDETKNWCSKDTNSVGEEYVCTEG